VGGGVRRDFRGFDGSRGERHGTSVFGPEAPETAGDELSPPSPPMNDILRYEIARPSLDGTRQRPIEGRISNMSD
jgi:hypothetical protein